jgi:hypothetical protein
MPSREGLRKEYFFLTKSDLNSVWRSSDKSDLDWQSDAGHGER